MTNSTAYLGAQRPQTQRSEPTGLRHTPVQARGRRRVRQLLQAAAELIATEGVDNTTTNAIAARAGTSVGVLYTFFPNKRALVEALAQDYVEAIEQLIAQQEVAGIAEWPLPAAIEWVLRALLSFHREHPAYPHVYRAARASSGDGGTRLLDQGQRIIDHLLALRRPEVPACQRRWQATAAVEAAHALVLQASQLPAHEADALFAESITLLTRYLAPEYASPT